VLGARTVGANLKICNVLHAALHARHDTLVVADADIRVRPDYLDAVTAPLDDPRVGLSTCLYVAVSGDDLASRLGAMFINDWFLPAACVGATLQPMRHAFGVTMACRRKTLHAIGGWEVLVDELADDYRLGALVDRRGLKVALVPHVVDARVVERNLRAL